MTRLWTPADPITVVTRASPASESLAETSSTGPPAHGGLSAKGRLPTSFTWQGQTHTVAHITREWRVDIDWWRERTWRAFYKLNTDTGLLVIIFQDLLTNQWYFLRLYD
jgi:hypothetical protein